jgi:PAS domain S-box-containing protein
MLKYLPLWLHPPAFPSAESTRRARLLYVLILTCLISGAAVATVYVFILPSNPLLFRNFLIALIGSIGLAGLLIGLRKGHLQTVSYIFIGFVWLIVAFSALLTGGNGTSGSFGLTVIVMLCGFVLGKRAGVLLAGISIFYGGILLGLDQAGLLSRLPFTSLNYWFTNSIYYVIAAVLVWLFIGNLEVANDKLKHYATELEQRVAARTAELAQSQARYRAILETQSEMICRYLPDTTLTFVNNAYCRHFGKTPEELIGRSFLELIPSDQRDSTRAYVQALVERPHEEVYEHQAINAEGELRWQAWRDTPIYDADGRVVEVQAVGEDITERRLAEREIQAVTQQLQETNQELEAFTYSVSHDLRAPLRAMDGFAKVLIENYAAVLPEQAQHYLRRIQGNATRMGTLIDDLLRLSRLGRQPLRLVSLSPTQLVNKLIDDLRAAQPDLQAHFEVTEMPHCLADHALLEQVYANLVNNAVKYSRNVQSPRIRINATTLEGETVYCVADNGVGFDPTYADKLFVVFQRLHDQRDYEGNGVGLAIVKRIITRHGGRIWAHGAPNQGATFYFTLGETTHHALPNR